MDRLLIIPIVFAAGYFLYRHIRKSIIGEGGCDGNCANCSLLARTDEKDIKI